MTPLRHSLILASVLSWIIITAAGYLWLIPISVRAQGRWFTIAAVDGTGVEVGLVSNEIQAIAFHVQGNAWIGTPYGVSRREHRNLQRHEPG